MPGAADTVADFADVAVRAGVRRLVLLSGRGEAEAQRAERAVQQAGADWTIVGASWFSQHFSENYLLDGILAGELALPVGAVPEPFVDAEDIADVVAAALTGHEHTGQAYELTGPGLPAPSGPINVSHWLGALITSARRIIGTRGTTPVRLLIDEAVSLVPRDKRAFCVVVQSGSRALHSVAFGDPQAAWAAAADVAAETRIRYLDAPVRRVLSIVPTMYHDIWTAAKGFYKVEPVVAAGGQVVVYAPMCARLPAPTRRSRRWATTAVITS